MSIKAAVEGGVTVITGPGFEFKKVGDLQSFTQRGKIPSIRAAKVVCKLLASHQGE
ncbi:hypothetical protein [Pseudomonas sp. Eqa60]|uniref:hypothetical protein n=1 Tax=Pseudomonas sp. Eqa60 TaxID=2799184 RepID=UPI001BB415CB|nr:hypothetical protein [Pseudomonas sp. Eqa60]